jgi:hypothetical protein
MKGNVSEVKNAHGYLNITSGWINGTGYTKDLNITGGKGIVHFNSTEVKGNLTGYIKLDQLTAANITINGFKAKNATTGAMENSSVVLDGEMAGWVYYTNGKDPIWVEGTQRITLNETSYFVGKVSNISVAGWGKMSTGGNATTPSNMTITGYADMSDINFYNATGNMTLNLSITDSLKGYISNFTIPKAGFNGTVAIQADQIQLRANNIRAELQGLWDGSGIFQKTNQTRPLGNISGYASMDLVNLLKATGYQSVNDIMIRDIQLTAGSTTISGQNAFFTADNPLELRLTSDSKIKSDGKLVDLSMKGYTSGDMDMTSHFTLPGGVNALGLLIPVVTTTGLVLGYMKGTRVENKAERKAAKKESKATLSEVKATREELRKLREQKITAEPDKTVTTKLESVDTGLKTVITKLDENKLQMADYFTLPKETTDAIDAVYEEAHKRHY